MKKFFYCITLATLSLLFTEQLLCKKTPQKTEKIYKNNESKNREKRTETETNLQESIENCMDWNDIMYLNTESNIWGYSYLYFIPKNIGNDGSKKITCIYLDSKNKQRIFKQCENLNQAKGKDFMLCLKEKFTELGKDSINITHIESY